MEGRRNQLYREVPFKLKLKITVIYFILVYRDLI
jgi:hypothetical protein